MSLTLSAWAAAATALAAQADLRDPTELPAALRQAPGTDGAASAAPSEIAIQHLVFVDGRYFLVVGGRRLRAGDPLGAARIARIDESAVWLTEAGVTRKQNLFAGVEKRAERPPGTPNSMQRPSRATPPSKENQ